MIPITILFNFPILYNQGNERDAKITFFHMFKTNSVEQYQKALLS